MEQKVRKVIELESLIGQATSPTVIRPDLRRFREISALMSSAPSIEKEFIKIVKTRLKSPASPKSMLMLLELIEYTTCTSDGALHGEYNEKAFLQVFNSIFNSKNLKEEVRDKALSIVQFWHFFFQAEPKVFLNFKWYYNIINERGVSFPNFQKSPYLSQVANPSSLGFQSPTPMFEENREDEPLPKVDPFGQMKTSARKLYKDLCDVYENIQLCNQMIDEKNLEITSDIIVAIKPLENRLMALPDKLMEAREDFLYKFCLSLIEDSGVTLDRHERLVASQQVPKFVSKASIVLKENNFMSHSNNSPIDIEISVNTSKLKPRQANANGKQSKGEGLVTDPFSKMDNKFYMKESISTIQAADDFDNRNIKDSMFSEFEFQQLEKDEDSEPQQGKGRPKPHGVKETNQGNPLPQNGNFRKEVRIMQQAPPLLANGNQRLSESINLESASNWQSFPRSSETDNHRQSNQNHQPIGLNNSGERNSKGFIDPPSQRSSHNVSQKSGFMDNFDGNFVFSQMPKANAQNPQSVPEEDFDLLSFDETVTTRRQTANPTQQNPGAFKDDDLLSFDNPVTTKPSSIPAQKLDIDLMNFNFTPNQLPANPSTQTQQLQSINYSPYFDPRNPAYGQAQNHYAHLTPLQGTPPISFQNK
jgi:hypothetical protein